MEAVPTDRLFCRVGSFSPLPVMLLSPLGERLGEGVMQEMIFRMDPLT
jgi:hypothetical protein